jgi:hypothetical protein
LNFSDRSFRTFTPKSSAIIDKYVFPDPASLMALCFYLGVHPADLIPKEMRDSAPSPRSIVQACQFMAEDSRFPAVDRERADDFLDDEVSMCMTVAGRDETLWQFVTRLDLGISQNEFQDIDMIWGKHNKRPHTKRAQMSQSRLVEYFGIKADPLPNADYYPQIPSMDMYQSAIHYDREHVRHTWRQANATKKRVGYHRDAMQEFANKIFGPTHATEGTAKTLLFLRDFEPNQKIPSTILGIFIGQQKSTCAQSAKQLGYESEEAMCEKWFIRCRQYMGAVDKFASLDSTARGMAEQFRVLYDPKFTNGAQMDCALDAYANYKITQTKGHDIPYMDELLTVYGFRPKEKPTLPKSSISPHPR